MFFPRRVSFSYGALIGAAFLLFGLSAAHAASRGLTVEIRAEETRGASVTGVVKLYATSHALVIGNDAYSGDWPVLSNAVKDARLVADALIAKGFDVTLKTNVNSHELSEALETFFYEVGQDPDARLFLWYAGHGYSEGGEGYLVPVDAPDPSETGSFLRKALSLRRMGEYVRGAKALHILSVFDSCFAGTIFNVGRAKPPPAITRATTRPVRQFLTSGDAGQEVSDNGTFRKLFIRAINGENRADSNRDGYLAASELGLFMTSEITNYTNGGQTPRNGKLNDPDLDRGDFIFQVAARAPTPVRPALPPVQAGGGSQSAELLFWESIKDSSNPADFEDYLNQFSNGTFAGIAKRRIAELKNPPARPKPAPPMRSGRNAEVAFWNSVQNSRVAADIQDYIRRFPNGIFTDLAKRRLGELTRKRMASRGGFETGVTGTYQGRITVGNSLGPVTTKFFIDPQGRLAGTYTYNGRFHDTLSNARRVGQYGVVFLWREPVGTGNLTINFVPGFRQFSGYWTTTGRSKQYSWNGNR